MIRNYFKIAWRNLFKNKIYSFINIFGLAIGMAVTIMITLWINDELNYDRNFKNYETIAQVYQSQKFNGDVSTGPSLPRPIEKVLNNKYGDNFKNTSMSSWTQPRYLEYGDKSISREGNFIQEEGLKIFEFHIIKGAKNGLKEPNSIMLSQSTALALFGDQDPIGKIVNVNSTDDMLVTAIFEDIPVNSTFTNVNFLMPWKYYIKSQPWIEQSEDNWGNNSFQMFVQIVNDTTMNGISKKIRDAKKESNEETARYDPQIFLFAMKDWHLRSNFENGVQTGGRIDDVWLFGIIGAFVLFLACINFMNLSTARSEKRAMEVGIRKAIGSNREQLIKQFLIESLLVVSLAFFVSILLVLLSLNGFNQLASKEIQFPWNNLQFWSYSLGFIVFTSLISGSYPALYLSSFRPVRVLKGTFKTGQFSALPRKILVVTQFTVSVALIIGTVVVMQQIQYSKNRPLGYEMEGLIQIPLMSPEFFGKYDFMHQQFLASGGVTEMSQSSSPTTAIWSNQGSFNWKGKPDGFQDDFAWTAVSYDYVESLGMKIVEGRNFSRKFASDSNAVLINEKAVEYMGIKDPIGQYLRAPTEKYPNGTLQIIGVVQDVVTQSPYEPVKQGIYAFDNNDNASFYNLKLNPDKSVSADLEIVENTFNKFFPNLPFEYQFIDKEYGGKFDAEERVASLAKVFTSLAIFISCLGLFGLASYVAEQRTKEIGVRKVLGATVANLWMLLSKDFIQLVLIALLIAIPLAYYLMHEWIQKFAYRTDLHWWIFLISALGALAITLITVSFQAIRAAIQNPVKSLRTE